MQYFDNYVDQVATALKNMFVTTHEGRNLEKDEGLAQWCQLTHRVKDENQVMYFVGNGASAMMASHMAADASKNGQFRSHAFNDVALLTAVSNDIAYEECFAVPLKRFANAGDVLVTISSSGNSPNITRAIEAARELGIAVITLSGMKPDNRSRQMGDVNFYVPGETYGIVESAHQALLHCWLDRLMEEYENN
jgi:D-sedoheptulose 7-phosphate isomerase